MRGEAAVSGNAFDRLWSDLAPIGRDDSTGGYRRFAWTPADMECRAWFLAAATERGLTTETDRNGNLWAWWGDPMAGDAVVVGSHLDSVPEGGAYDGPLGVVSAFAALDAARSRGLRPSRPVGVVAFSDEEGARFGVACGGSRLLTGALDAGRARALVDGAGVTMAEAMAAAGHDPARLGAEPDRLARIGCFVELHIEQGRVRVETADGPAYGLAGLGAPIGVASAIWPHGRWRFELTGRADHAGTTRLDDRDDPMLVYAATVLAAREAAIRHDALATVGKVRVEPNGVNAIPSRVTAWLDARGADERRVRALVADLASGLESLHSVGSGQSAHADGGRARLTEESWTDLTIFDASVRDRLVGLLGGVPILPTGAGHDAGILAAAGVPAGMLFVRNPTGVSHSPDEHAERTDCLAGVDALATVLTELGVRHGRSDST
jgi:beta-ureidopropionase / N-carbamoyl-L-amino-acid hydrolase